MVSPIPSIAASVAPHRAAPTPPTPEPWRTRLLHSQVLVWVTSPLIWSCLVPLAFLDLIGTVYQSICFPVYGIPKVRRRDYLVFDRHRLDYLTPADKLNCEYCAYANGMAAYFTEIAARTEQHWCPIKHARQIERAHSRYEHFLAYGDAAGYRARSHLLRRAFAEPPPTVATTKVDEPPSRQSPR